MKNFKLFAASLMMIASMFTSVLAQDGGPNIALQPFLAGLSSPVFMTSPTLPPGGRLRSRFFVVQQGGIIRLADVRRGPPTTFMDITTRVLSGGERGLLGLAFHPQYTSNRKFYVYYTRQTDGAIQISEFLASATNPNIGDPASERLIITIPHPVNSNHNGGTVAFGADGYLYAGPGDGGGGNDTANNAQNLNVLLGKIIRLDVDTTPPVGQTYVIPPTNPYVGVAGADEIYAVGMRNPYRFSFDRGGTNQLWAADVGQGAFEEVDIITNGGNYGWRVYEGNQCTGLGPAACIPANYIFPIFQYSLSGPRCAVIGGYVYRGTSGVFPADSYIYGDYCTGEILLWDGVNQVQLLDTALFITGFAEDEVGEIYVIGQNGTVQKIIAAP